MTGKYDVVSNVDVTESKNE